MLAAIRVATPQVDYPHHTLGGSTDPFNRTDDLVGAAHTRGQHEETQTRADAETSNSAHSEVGVQTQCTVGQYDQFISHCLPWEVLRYMFMSSRIRGIPTLNMNDLRTKKL